MNNASSPSVHREWLTPLQLATLERFFAADVGQAFFLTGGAALAAFHLHHRLSVDLDLFTSDELSLREASALFPRLAVDLGCQIGQARTTEHFRRFLLEPESGPLLQVDFVRDFSPQFGQHSRFGEIVVDSVENIGANKLIAMLSRTDAKDFVDLAFILRAGHDLDDLLAKAQEKDPGMHPFYLAGAMRQVHHLHILPATTPSLELAELRDGMSALADQLLDQLRPPARPAS
jgi:hypothetical protein